MSDFEPEPDQSPMIPTVKFITDSKRPRGTPSSRHGRIIFAYNMLEKSYYLYESNSSLPLLESMCRRNQIHKHEIFEILKCLANSFETSQQRAPLSESKSLAYNQSMKTLYFAIACFLIYIFIIFFEIYNSPGSHISSIGLVFGYFGLFLCAIVVCGKGQKKIGLLSKNTLSLFIDSYHRHEVFELLNRKNSELRGLALSLGLGGRWIELEEVES